MIINTTNVQEMSNAIDDLELQLKMIKDMASRIDEVDGSYQVLRLHGFPTQELRRNALTLEYSLGYQVEGLKKTLSLYESSGV